MGRPRSEDVTFPSLSEAEPHQAQFSYTPAQDISDEARAWSSFFASAAGPTAAGRNDKSARSVVENLLSDMLPRVRKLS